MSDWIELRSTNFENADKLQKHLAREGAMRVIVASSLDTIIEVSGKHNNGKNGWVSKIAGEHNSRIRGTSVKPLRSDQYMEVACRRIVLDTNMLDHLNMCKTCNTTIAPEDVKATKSRELNTERDKATAYNNKQPVITRPLEEQPVEEPAMEVTSIERSGMSIETYPEILEYLSHIETELYERLDRVDSLKKAFKEMDATEKKLKELDEELARIEEERKRILTSGLNN